MPIQHISPTILKSMGRPENPQDITSLISRLRKEVPDITLRTTMMVGFPGESEEDHQAMLDFIRGQAFEWLGAFIYSPEEGSPAAKMKKRVPKIIARQRYDAVMNAQGLITENFNKHREGRQTSVLVEGYDSDMRLWEARSHAEAPQVDGMILIKTTEHLAAGQFVTATLMQASLYDIYARIDPQREATT